MNKTKYFMVFASLVCGCGVPATVVINPLYEEEASLKNRTLNILLIPSDTLIVENIDDVQDDFPNDTCRPPSVVIQDSLSRTIREEFTTGSNRVQCFFEAPVPDSFQSQNRKELFDFLTKSIIKKDPVILDFAVPQKQHLIEAGLQPDIGLVISKILFGRNLGERDNIDMPVTMPGQTISTPGGGTINTPGMNLGGRYQADCLGAYFQFILWDYKNNCEIAYGKMSVLNYFRFGMTKNTWKDEFRSIAEALVKETPLKKMSKPKSTNNNVSW